MGELWRIAAENGFIAILLAVFVWQTFKSNDRMTKKVDGLEVRLLNLIEETTKQLEQSSVAIEASTQAVHLLKDSIDLFRSVFDDHLIKHGKRP